MTLPKGKSTGSDRETRSFLLVLFGNVIGAFGGLLRLSRRPSILVIASLAMMTAPVFARELRVCADPNNLPYSNQAREGFENKIVELIAQDIGSTVSYTWWAQRRGNVRNTLKAGLCDVIPGVASELDMVQTTKPYYRSSYMFVVRRDRHLDIHSLDDPRLKHMMIGVQMVGDDFANTPPAHALTRRGIVDNVRGFMLYGNYGKQTPTRDIVDAVIRREIDLAIVWGPQAGYFGRQQSRVLNFSSVEPAFDGPLPMRFDISMGLRKGDRELLRVLNEELARNASEIRTVLQRYGVPNIEDARVASE
jgi:mxaJ protein